MVGPDDAPGVGEVVTVDPNRITRLGMYQATTSGRRLFSVHHGKRGPYIDWLGDWANPDPHTTHLVAAHRCGTPPADHWPAANAQPTDFDNPPF